MAALLQKGCGAKVCVSCACYPFGWGSGSFPPSPTAVTSRQAVAPDSSRCPCLCFPGGQAVMERPPLFQDAKTAQELADLLKLQRNSSNLHNWLMVA